MHRDSRRRFGRIVSNGGWLRHDDMHRDTRRRFVSIVSCFPGIMHVIYGILNGLRDDRRCDATATACPMTSPGSPVVNMACFVGIATLGVGVTTACPMSSRDSPALDMGSFGATSRRKASWEQTTRWLTSVFHVVFDSIQTFICANMSSCGGIATIGVATLGVGFQRRVQWHPEDHLHKISRFGAASWRSASVW
jgi:hypothetical protein